MKNKIKSILRRLNFKRSVELTWSVSKRLTIITVFFLLLENILWMGSIYMLKQLVNIVSKQGNSESREQLISTIIISGLISIAYACTKSLSGYFSELQATKVNHYVDSKIHEHTYSLDYSFYEDPEYLDVLKRAREAGVDKPYAVVSSLFDIVKNSITMAVIGFLLISIDWMLLPLLTLFVLPVLIGRIFFSNRGFLLYIQNTALERKSFYLSSLITADTFAKEIRTFMLGKYLLKKYMGIKDDLITQKVALNKKRTINELVTTGLGTTAFFGVTAYIVFGTLSGKTSVGDIAVFLVIFPQSYSIMQALVGAITNLYQNNMYVAHIFDLFNLRSSVENRISLPAVKDSNNSGLKVENVSFSYPNTDKLALRNISMHIPPGKIIALVGMNGAGKTTLIKLLCKLYEPEKGLISLNGIDIRNFSASDYRKNISVVFQDFVRYNLTVRENIAFGDIDSVIRNEEIKKAGENSGAAAFIESFPDAYDTVLGRQFEDGHELSIGQWQKIAIARAFYSKSKLIILDEATSALDVIAENELFRSFRERIEKRSALVISHRLSTIRQADYIYVLADQQITESGTHDELINSGGKYANLYNGNPEVKKSMKEEIA